MSGVTPGPSRTTKRPSTRMRGGDPTFRCRSDPLAVTIASSQAIMLVNWLSPSPGGARCPGALESGRPLPGIA